METTIVRPGMGKLQNASQIKVILESVPENKWLTEMLGDDNDPSNGLSCALGHVNRYCNQMGEQLPNSNIRMNNPCYFGTNQTNDSYNFNRLAKKFLAKKYGCTMASIGDVVYNVNDTPGYWGYDQDTPRERVLALVTDMIEAGF